MGVSSRPLLAYLFLHSTPSLCMLVPPQRKSILNFLHKLIQDMMWYIGICLACRKPCGKDSWNAFNRIIPRPSITQHIPQLILAVEFPLPKWAFKCRTPSLANIVHALVNQRNPCPFRVHLDESLDGSLIEMIPLPDHNHLLDAI